MSFPPAALNAAVSIYAAKEAFDAYEYYRDRVVENADESLTRAKDLWRIDKKLKAKVPEGYEWLATIPEYETCEHSILRSAVPNRSKSVAAARQAARQGASRGQIGLRRRLAREVSLEAIRQTAVTADIAMQVEDRIGQMYLDLKDASVMDNLRGTGTYGGVAGANRDSATLFTSLAANQNRAFNASMSAVGGSIGSLMNAAKSSDNTPASPERNTSYNTLEDRNWYI